MNADPIRSTFSLTRRTALAGLGAGGLGLALAVHPAAARDSTAEMANHPIVGTFLSLHLFAGTGFGR